jgi:tRNA(Arg) A34 adenosine deaminase TadA
MEERVAAAVLEAYEGLRIKDGGCWTVVAGVAAVAGDDIEVLSVASGCKCVGGQASPALVRDGHAEVLAVRALRRALCEDPALHARLLAEDLWLYVTAPPCGDCAIFALDDGTVAFTGAKLGDWRREDPCGTQPLVWGVPTKLQNSLSRSHRSRFG